MSRFYVGQRVKINCPASDGHGEVVSVIELNHAACDEGCWYVGHMVDLEDWPEDIARGGERFCTFEPHELIPLDDDSRQLTTWDQCAWKPRATVTGEQP